MVKEMTQIMTDGESQGLQIARLRLKDKTPPEACRIQIEQFLRKLENFILSWNHC